MHAEIISIGDEITSGQLLDTNSQWLSQRLEELGIRVLYHSTVGDEIDPLSEVFRQAIERSDVVISTGGLGPTADDLTRPALAKATGRELVRDEKALAEIRAKFARRGRTMPQRNEQQADFPAGARPIDNPHGTAPGIELEVERPGHVACRVFALPGVPAEMKEMWQSSVSRSLLRMGAGGRIIRQKRINCFGLGESQIEAMLPDLVRRGRQPRVGITASQATIILRITAEGASEAECEAAMAPTIATIRRCLGNLVYGEDDEQLQDVVVRLLGQRRRTLATAEWGTAGLVTQWLDGVPEAAERFVGGAVTPTSTALRNVLGVGAELLREQQPSSGPIVQQMAIGCRERFGAYYGLAVGAFPGPDARRSSPAAVFFALASPAGVRVQSVPFAIHPAQVKVYCAKHALNLVRLAMLEEEPAG